MKTNTSDSRNAVCIIPARGGSRRIPRKNITGFYGKPLIAWSVEAAVRSGVFDTVMVSTDDSGIADVARAFGAEVLRRLRRFAQNDIGGVRSGSGARLNCGWA